MPAAPSIPDALATPTESTDDAPPAIVGPATNEAIEAAAAAAAAEPPATLAAPAASKATAAPSGGKSPLPPAGIAQDTKPAPALKDSRSSLAASQPALARDTLRITALPALVGAPVALRIEVPEGLRASHVPGDEMNLFESVRRALFYSYAVKAAAARVEVASQTERTALGRLLPRVDARISSGAANYETSTASGKGWMSRADSSLTLNQPLFNFSDYMTWRQQGALSQVERERRSNTNSSIALEAASAFLAVYQAQLIIEYGEVYRDMLTELERYVGERAKAGATSQADAERVRARVANVRSSLAENRSVLFTALGNMRRLVGMLPGRIGIGELSAELTPRTLDSARSEAIASNPDLASSRSEVDAARLERRATLGRFMPSVGLEVSQLEFKNSSGAVGTQTDQRVLVVVNVPLYTGGGDLATLRALEAKRKEKEFILGDKERRLVFELEGAFSVIDSINPRFDSTRTELESNRRVVDAFREQLFAANRSLLDVLDAYQRLYQSKVDLTTLLVSETRTKLQLAHLSGRLYRLLPEVELPK